MLDKVLFKTSLKVLQDKSKQKFVVFFTNEKMGSKVTADGMINAALYAKCAAQRA